MRPDVAARLRRLPKIDAVLGRDDVRALDAPRWAVVEAARREVEALRQRILAGEHDAGAHEDGAVEISAGAIERRVAELIEPSLRRVINATGVVLHTNLGRAPLADRAVERLVEVSRGYSNLEYDVNAGRRGSRHQHVSALLAELTGAEDAAVVNNNAGAVMLCLAALASGGEVVVSRGELVEIGGSFRIPDVMRLSGARLVEVGTTNKTRAADYRAAVGEDTALLLKVHRSNFAIVGFTEEVSLAELAALGREHAVTSMMDLGSGSLLAAEELRGMGLAAEPGVAQVMASGVDVVTFSGDKLLGGPQAGIICGRRSVIAAVRSHPLMRALRPDKLTVAALEATLALYRDGRAAEVPAVAMLGAPAERVRERAERVLAELGDAARGPRVRIELAACQSAVGGGAMPLCAPASWGLAMDATGTIEANGQGEQAGGAAAIERALRSGPVPVIGRIADDRVILDMRTVSDRDIELLIAVLRSLQAD